MVKYILLAFVLVASLSVSGCSQRQPWAVYKERGFFNAAELYEWARFPCANLQGVGKCMETCNEYGRYRIELFKNSATDKFSYYKCELETN
jgi:uncharacterized membrane protein YobD (UPF0266 family)